MLLLTPLWPSIILPLTHCIGRISCEWTIVILWRHSKQDSNKLTKNHFCSMNIPMIVWHQQWRKTVWRAFIAVMCDGKIDKRRVHQSVHVPCLPLFFVSYWILRICDGYYNWSHPKTILNSIFIIISILPLESTPLTANSRATSHYILTS